MKKTIFLMIFFFIMIPLYSGFSQDDAFGDFSQDNVLGDYLLSSVKKNVSLEFEEANLLDVLKMFSQYTSLNFVSTEMVKSRTLTLYMEDVPIREAMNVIFKANNLTYDYYPEANIFVVKEMGKPSIDVDTKVYRLKYARVSGSKFQSEVDSITGGSSTGAIKSAIERILSEYGKIVEDPVTNSIIVTDVPVQFPRIDKVVAELDIAPQKVLIEVEMIDVNKQVIDESGVTFGSGADTGGFRTAFTIFPGGISSDSENTYASGSYRFDSPPSPWRQGSMVFNFAPAFQAIFSDSTTKILARPKILTLSGETAEIGIVTDAVVGTTSEKSEEQGTTVSISAERAETGVTLRVTPVVNAGTEEITMVLQPTVKDTSDSAFQDENANTFINIEESSTKSVLRLRAGQTILIGGLIRDKFTDASEGIPYLKDIPFLGKLFGGSDKNTQERELLVFLTPHIVDDGDTMLVKKESIPYREQKNSFKQKTVSETLDKYK
jgi:type II secretory pathway component GspD/PulD (secretin)